MQVRSAYPPADDASIDHTAGRARREGLGGPPPSSAATWPTPPRRCDSRRSDSAIPSAPSTRRRAGSSSRASCDRSRSARATSSSTAAPGRGGSCTRPPATRSAGSWRRDLGGAQLRGAGEHRTGARSPEVQERRARHRRRARLRDTRRHDLRLLLLPVLRRDLPRSRRQDRRLHRSQSTQGDDHLHRPQGGRRRPFDRLGERSSRVSRPQGASSCAAAIASASGAATTRSPSTRAERGPWRRKGADSDSCGPASSDCPS